MILSGAVALFANAGSKDLRFAGSGTNALRRKTIRGGNSAAITCENTAPQARNNLAQHGAARAPIRVSFARIGWEGGVLGRHGEMLSPFRDGTDSTLMVATDHCWATAASTMRSAARPKLPLPDPTRIELTSSSREARLIP